MPAGAPETGSFSVPPEVSAASFSLLGTVTVSIGVRPPVMVAAKPEPISTAENAATYG